MKLEESTTKLGQDIANNHASVTLGGYIRTGIAAAAFGYWLSSWAAGVFLFFAVLWVRAWRAEEQNLRLAFDALLKKEV